MASVEIWLYILIFISLLLFGLGTGAFIGSFRGRREIIERLKQIGEGTHPQEEKGFLNRLINFGAKSIERLGDRVRPKEEKKASNVRMTLIKAGYRRVNAPVTFLYVTGLFSSRFAPRRTDTLSGNLISFATTLPTFLTSYRMSTRIDLSC